MSDAEALAVSAQRMGVPQVLELFEPQLQAFTENIAGSENRLAIRREALAGAEVALQDAREVRDEALEAVHQSEGDVRISRQLLATGKKSAIGALHALDVPAAQTFVGQTLIEGGSKEEAEDALNELRRLNQTVAPEDRRRLIVLGSFPTRAAFVDGDDSSYYGVSFVDLDPASDRSPLGLHREIHGENRDRGHFLRVVATQVTQIPFNPLSALRDAEHDSTKRQRYVNASPLDLRVVTTEEKLVKVIHQGLPLDEVPKKYGAITVGTEEEDSFPPTVIAGEAAGKFTEWLARNEWMRTMVYVATADKNGQADHVPELPEDSEYISDARDAFRQRLLFQANRMKLIGWRGSDDEEAATSLRNEPLLQPHVQRYLGISEDMIARWLTDDLKSDVTLEVPTTFSPDRPVKFKVDSHSQLGRYFSSVEELCDVIDHNFKEAGFDLGVLPQVAKRIKQQLLSQKLASMKGASRADRKVRAKVSDALDAVGVE